MSPRPRLAVVVPTLDEEPWIGALLRRLRAGAGPADVPDEVVVADGQSSDRTVELALAAGARVVQAPRGRGAQLAAGARATQAECLLFLHADCVPRPGAVALVRRAFETQDLRWGALEQRIQAEGLFFRLVAAGAGWRVRRLGLALGDSGLAVRREVYEAAGGFADLALLEDVDLSRRLRRQAPAVLLRGALLDVSARRWRRHGALRTTLRNWMILGAYALGADPRALARHYPPHARGRRPA